MEKLNYVCFTFFLATCFIGSSIALPKPKDSVIKLMRNQTELEMQASLFYQTYGHFFEHSAQALHGFAQYFYDQSVEEKKHADKLMTYLNQRNVRSKTLALVPSFCTLLTDSSLCDFITGTVTTRPIGNTIEASLTAISNALELEEKVYLKLDEIASSIDADPQLSHFIEHEFLDEQIESMKELEDYKTQLTGIGKHYVGLLLMDRWFMEKKKP